MARILITGAAGFIGSHLFDYLNGKHDVYGIDDYSIGNYRHDKIYNVDLKDASEVERMVKEVKPKIVYHLAAWAHEGLSQFCPVRITENNYLGFLNLVVSCIRNGVKKIVTWSVRYENLAALEAVNQRMAANKKYQDMVMKGVDNWLPGSVNDALWQTV